MGRVKFLQAGAFNMKGGGVAPSPLHPFLALMQEKDAKRKSRHQGCRPNFPAPEGVIRDAGQFGRVPDFFVVHLSFSVVSGRGVLHTPHKRPDRDGCRMMGRVKFLQAGAYNMEGGGVAP